MNPIIPIDREHAAIYTFFANPTLADRLYDDIHKDYFMNGTNATIWRCIHRYKTLHGKLPTPQNLVAEIDASPKGKDPGDVRQAFIDIITNLDTLKDNIDISIVESWIRMCRVRAEMDKGITNSNNPNYDWQTATADMATAALYSLDSDPGLDLGDIDKAQELLQSVGAPLESPFDTYRKATSTIDAYGNIIPGGHYRKTLTMYTAGPNAGKTMLLCNDAAHLYLRGRKVLYITLEIAEEDVWARVMANITGIEMNQITWKDPLHLRNEVDKAKQSGDGCRDGGMLFIKSLSSAGLMHEIENATKDCKDKHGLDALCVDYIALVKPKQRKGTTNIERMNMAELGTERAEQLRDIAKQNEIAVLSAGQIQREAYNDKDGNLKYTAGSVGYNNTCDAMINVGQDAGLLKANAFLMTNLKCRKGQKGTSWLAAIDYNRQRVSDPNDEERRRIHDMTGDEVAQAQAIQVPRVPSPVASACPY